MQKQQNYILFIDESGKSKLSDDHDDFLLSGLIIDKDLHSALSSYMISLKEKSSIPTTENIHAFDLFEGEREKMYTVDGGLLKNRDGTRRHRRIPYPRIDTFFKRLTGLIEGADMYCFIYRIDKSWYRERITRIARRRNVSDRLVMDFIKREGLNDFLYEALARKLILEFGHFLETKDAYGEVMAESRRQEDDAVLAAFISASHKSTFAHTPRYQMWAKFCLKRIHSLTFQNKKGLSFGLEVADLFGWAHFNSTYGRSFPIASEAKKRRVESRINRANSLMNSLHKKGGPEEISRTILSTIARDRVSEFTKALVEYRIPSVPSGTPPGNPGRP
ncbi:MAG: hypothetical protein B7W96_00265 [Parcubacteria group bacterium 37-58-5]|nr:MAG: hypothetical protein B7W96_00265 [Parcubacteria group bacterium 37-58-5]